MLSLILANLTSALVSIPGHIYDVIQPPEVEYVAQYGYVSDTSYETDDADEDGVTAAMASWSLRTQGVDGVTVLVALASVLSILLISLDRYYAVNSPLHYGIIVTRRKSIAMIGVVWGVSLVLSAPVWSGVVLLHHPAEWDSVVANRTEDAAYANDAYWMSLCYGVSLMLFGFVWPLAALCWLYLRMYQAALRNSARTRRQSLSSNPAETLHLTGTDLAAHQQPEDTPSHVTHPLPLPTPPMLHPLHPSLTAADHRRRPPNR